MAQIRIGTRGSKLALWQAEWVATQLRNLGEMVELKIITTTGDVSSQSLSQVGGQGLFTKEIQRELLSENVDVAVHSLKDLPTQPIPGLQLAAVPERESTFDCLLSRDGKTFVELASGAVIGTGSLRRASQLRAWRRDIDVRDIRGNVDTRISKMLDGHYDAIVLAHAGLRRLGLEHHVVEQLPQDRILPAIGQGALGLECRQGDEATRTALHALNHAPSFAAVTAERSLLLNLLAGCLAPVAAQATVDGQELTLRGRVMSVDGKSSVEASMKGTTVDAAEVGRKLAELLISRGASELIAEARRS